MTYFSVSKKILKNICRISLVDDRKDALESEYLEHFLKCCSLLKITVKDEDLTLKLIENFKNAIQSWKFNLQNDDNNNNNKSEWTFEILSFPKHSAAFVIETTGDPTVRKLHVLETRPTSFTSTVTLTNSIPGVPHKVRKDAIIPTDTLKNFIPVPTATYDVESVVIEDAIVREHIRYLQKTSSPYPVEVREIRQPVFVLEGLLPQLRGVHDQSVEPILMVADDYERTYKVNPSWDGEGWPWRRSVHYTTLKFALRLIARRLSPNHGDVAYKKFMVLFVMWLTEQLLETNPSSKDLLQRCLQKVAKKTGKLSDEDFVYSILQRCKKVANHISELVESTHKTLSNKYTLPDLTQGVSVPDPYFVLGGKFDEFLERGTSFVKLPDASGDLNEIVEEDLEGFGVEDDLEQLLHWAEAVNNEDGGASLDSLEYALRTVEDRFLRGCWSSDGSPLNEPTDTLQPWCTSEDAPALAHKIVDFCMSASKDFCRRGGRATLEQHSRTVLVVWSAALVADLAARTGSVLVRDYGLPLDATRLGHLLLRDREEYAFAASIHCRLDVIFHSSGAACLFDHGDNAGHTLEFALDYARRNESLKPTSSIQMQKILEIETTEMLSREVAYHQEVEQRKRDEIRLTPLVVKARKKYSDLPRLHPEQAGAHKSYWELKAKLEYAQSSPDPVIQPLPEDKASALTVIFFMHMPHVLGHLSALVNLSLYCLTKDHNWYGDTPIKEWEVDPISWKNHCSCHAKYVGVDSATAVKDAVLLMSSNEGLAYSHFRKTLKVFYPNDLTLIPAWQFNGQWLLPKTEDIDILTKRLFCKDIENKNLQWLVSLPKEDNVSRENKILCSQSRTPQWLEPLSYMAFGRLRAFPNLQVREVLFAIQSDVLGTVMSRSEVRKVLQQALRQIGPINLTRPGWRLWKSDLAHDDFCQDFMRALSLRIEELKERPRDHQSLLVIIDISAWLITFKPTAAEILRQAYEVASKWYEAKAIDLRDIVEYPEREDQIRALQVQYSAYQVLAMAALLPYQPTVDDVFKLVRARVANNVALVIVNEEFIATVADLISEVRSAMCARASILSQLLGGNISIYSQEVSAAAAIAYPRLNERATPPEWTKIAGTVLCYTTKASEDCLKMNVLDGTVLINNFPIGRLPCAILNDKLYIRVFGRSSFPVSVSPERTHYISQSATDGCYYNFGLNAFGKLLVREDNVKSVQHKEVVLVRPSLLSVLPSHLKNGYSAWLDMGSSSGLDIGTSSVKSLVLRDVCFRGVKHSLREDSKPSFIKTNEFVLTVSGNRASCYHLPPAPIRQTTAEALEFSVDDPRIEQLLPPSCAPLAPLMVVLKKFEDVDNILPYSAANNSQDKCLCRLHFVCLNLGFTLKNGELLSNEYRDYALSPKQQLSDTLLGYSQYLVLSTLCPSNTLIPSTIVVSRDGTFVHGQDSVTINKLSPDLFTKWEVNNMGQLSAPQIGTRLALAAVYAATSSLIPDVRVGMTGIEFAMQLVRQCFSIVPFEPSYLNRLRNVYDIAAKHTYDKQGSYALQLLVRWLYENSMQLSFLHSPVKHDLCLPFVGKLEKRLAKKYWKEKLAANERCSLLVEEEMHLFGKTFEKQAGKVVRPRLISYSRDVELILGDRKALINEFDPSALSQLPCFSTTNQANISLTAITGLAFEWRGSIISTFFDVYEKLRVSVPGSSEDRKLCLSSSFLMLEGMRLSELSSDDLELVQPPIEQDAANALRPLAAVLLIVASSTRAQRLRFPSAAAFVSSRYIVPCSDANVQLQVTDVREVVLQAFPLQIWYNTKFEEAEANRELDDKVTFSWNALANHGDIVNNRPAAKVLFTDFDCQVRFQFSARNSLRTRHDTLASAVDSLLLLNGKYRRACLALGTTKFLTNLGAACRSLVSLLRAVKVSNVVDASIHRLKSHVVSLVRMAPSLGAVEKVTSVSFSFTEIVWIREELVKCFVVQPDTLSEIFKLEIVREEYTKKMKALIDADDIDATDEDDIKNMMQSKKQLDRKIKELRSDIEVAIDESPPISISDYKTPMGQEFVKKLNESWEEYRKSIKSSPQILVKDKKFYDELSRKVDTQMRECEIEIKAALDVLPVTLNGFVAELHRLSHIAAPVTDIDVLVSGLPANRPNTLNQFLSDSCDKALCKAVQAYLILRVYSAQLIRLKGLAEGLALGTVTEAAMLLELQALRDDDASAEPPEWVLLEIEQGVSIRSNQRKIAAAMIENPRKQFQMNMGDGKSKYVVPMLSCFWADGKQMVRVNSLTSLLTEVYDYLHRVLGGMLHRRVYVMPFNRDVQLDASKIAAIGTVMQQCRSEGAIMLAAPEHRLSLRLKWLELGYNEMSAQMSSMHSDPASNLRDLFSNSLSVPTLELLDESDELLRHTYQLVYPIGAQLSLHEFEVRAIAAQAVLRYLNSDKDLTLILSDESRAVRHEAQLPGAFASVRIIDTSGDTMVKIRIHLVTLLLSQPPRELVSLQLAMNEDKNVMRDFLLNINMNDKSSLDRVASCFKEDRVVFSALLALRGLLTFGVLEHCLCKRHSVDYGVNPLGSKLMAVPFRAKDFASDRTEFGHPDVALTLTIIHYYYTGLSRDQVREAFVNLLKAGASERDTLYSEWLTLSSVGMSLGNWDQIGSASRIDLQNEAQLDLLVKVFNHNMETINFWLNKVVFPVEAIQFPEKLVANAHDLAACVDDGSSRTAVVHGFSGTDDNSSTLPLCIGQLSLPELRTTNGKVLDVLTDPQMGNTKYTDVAFGWEAIVDALVNLHFDGDSISACGPVALIDAGALMTGISNLGVCKEIMRRFQRADRFLGSIFFNPAGRLVVLDKYGRVSDLSDSAIRPADCFVYFDDAHTRGADLRLKPQAAAVVTVGKGMLKDKLVQAVMRMRQLGHGQTVHFFGSLEVTRKISVHFDVDPADLTSRHVLQWATSNTVEALELAMVEWARQGASHAAKEGVSRRLFTGSLHSNVVTQLLSVCIDKELQTLEEFYGGIFCNRSSLAVVKSHMHGVTQRLHKLLHSEEKGVRDEIGTNDILKKFRVNTDEIIARAEKYVQDRQMTCTSLDEEYERELQMQVEEEAERELPPPQLHASEYRWDSMLLLHMALEFPPEEASRFMQKSVSLATVLQRSRCLRKHSDLKFDSNITVTENFSRVLIDENVDCDKYLRPADVVICIGPINGAKSSNGDFGSRFLLLSGAEANRAIPLFWKSTIEGNVMLPNSVRDMHFLHYPLLNHSAGLTIPSSHQSLNSSSLVDDLEAGRDRVRVQLRLFMGECNYPGENDRQSLRRMLGVLTKSNLATMQDCDIEWLWDLLKEHSIISNVGKVKNKRNLEKLIDSDAISELANVSYAVLTSVISNAFDECVVPGSRFGEVMKMIAVNLRGRGRDYELSDLSRLCNGTME